MSRQSSSKLGAYVQHHGVMFRVWAPFAKSVAVTGDWNNWGADALTSEPGGIWSGLVEAAEAGQTYRYLITTADDQILKHNDPRARSLTNSDTGNSIIVDDDFEWHDDNFQALPIEQQIIYELHVGTFHRPDPSTAGSFGTAIEKLDYLKELGITTIELMPITSMMSSSGWGYAPNYIFAVESSLGGRRGLMEFVEACHERGLGVILDVVYNHFYPKTDVWQFDGWSENDRGGIYFYNDDRGDTPWGGRPDYGRREVRDYLLDNLAMWLIEYHVDGFRVDSTIYMRNVKGPDGGPETEIPDAWSLLSAMTDLAHKIKPSALMIAEDSSNDPALTAAVKDGGAGFDAQWGLAFPYALRRGFGLVDGEPSIEPIAGELMHFYNGRVFSKVIFSDSHDTAANGSVRLNEAVDPDGGDDLLARKRLLLADAISLTGAGIPMMLQGQEFMQDGSFNDWQDLEWRKAVQFRGIVLAHQHLTALRHNYYQNTPGLTGADIEIFHKDAANRVIGYRRYNRGQKHSSTLVIANFGDKRFDNYDIYLPSSGLWRVRFNSSWRGYSNDFHEANYSSVEADKSRKATITLSDYQVIILSKD